MEITESYSLNILIIVCICIACLIITGIVTYAVHKIVKLREEKIKEVPNTVDEDIRRNMLPTGFYIICGRQRIGKGALGTAVMDTDCTYHCAERLSLAQKEINAMNAIRQENPYRLHLPDFPYRSKNSMLLGPDYRETYHMDVKQFALPDGQNDVQYIPPYTMIHAEELDAYMNCRSWKDAGREKANTIDAIKWLGHNEITYIGDAQRLDRLDAGARALVTDIWYIVEKRDFTAKDEELSGWRAYGRSGEIVRTEWTFYWIKNQLRDQSSEMKSLGEKIEKDKYITKCKFNYYGNIYERYNSNSGKMYWYKGIEDFYVEKQPDDVMTREAIEDYCKRNARRAEKGEDIKEIKGTED